MKYFIRMHNSWSFKYTLMGVKISRMKKLTLQQI